MNSVSVNLHRCTVTIMYFYTILHNLMWANFGVDYLTFGTFSIIQARGVNSG